MHTQTLPTISSVLSSIPSFASLRRRSSNLSSSTTTSASNRSSLCTASSSGDSPITPQSNTPRFGPVDGFDSPVKHQLNSVFSFSHILSFRPPSRMNRSVTGASSTMGTDSITSSPKLGATVPFGFISMAPHEDEVFEAGLSVLEPRPRGLGCVGLFEVLERW